MSESHISDSPHAAVVRRAHPSEAEVIADVIRISFSTVAETIGIDIPPLHETADDILSTFAADDVVLVAEREGMVVGTVRGETLDTGDVMIRRLAVLPDHRRSGIARALMHELEASYPTARRFELFTGADAGSPLALYESLGYSLMPRRDDEPAHLVYLEKRRPSKG